MQDGVRPHRTAEVFDFLSEHSDNHVVALYYEMRTKSGMVWPPYSPDLTPCDFFGGYLKDMMYPHNPQTIVELEQYISAAYQTIPTEMFARASANFVLRLCHVVVANSGYFENIVL
ncbi:hypothetical protein AVEN_120653-1 [Araneus ventricosus]|uniref:Tc1-like transposase DDE domain-containing protein n=1 Tax=Araneus ventricosus TaxID=182803 RepID=A0A4Y2T740_ARAVE|nr:hypothetical protein AVEN_120653-1 [Araneus ventricosus]